MLKERSLSLAGRMAQVLAEMSVLSEVAAATHGDVVHGGEKNQAPRGPRRSMAEEFAAMWYRARPLARAGVLRAAEEALRAARISRYAAHGLIPETLEWRVAIGRAEGSVEVVAHKFGVSRGTVYRLREQFAISAEPTR